MENITLTQEVAKESIPQLSFSKARIKNQDPLIRKNLDLAMRAGNSNHIKYRIEFASNSGNKTVDTTVWAVGEKYICLKGGVWLPIASIYNIRTL